SGPRGSRKGCPSGRSSSMRTTEPVAGAVRTRRRGRDKRDRIVEAAMRHFAERGYQAARVQDVAAELGISKASVFQHFGTKDELFLAAFRRAARSFDAYLEAPAAVRSRGFFATLEYWLSRTEHLVRDDWIPYRVSLIGMHAAELSVKREINRFLAEEDPYGTVDLVRFGSV